MPLNGHEPWAYLRDVLERLPARVGFSAVVKHLPDQRFCIDGPMYRWLGARFAQELALWGGSADVRMVIAATFHVAARCPKFQALALMPVDLLWLPVPHKCEQRWGAVGNPVVVQATVRSALS